MRAWGPAELQAFLGRVRDDRLYAAWALAASTGLRRSELLGLRWQGVDLDSGELSVTDSLVLVDHQPVLRPFEGKTTSCRRVLALDPETVAILRDHRRRQLEERLALGLGQPGGLVLTTETGDPINPSWLTRSFGRLVRDAGLPPIRLHDLRHTYASLALKAGVPLKVVSERLGHASTKITADTYQHVTKGMDREAAEKVAALVFGRREGGT